MKECCLSLYKSVCDYMCVCVLKQAATSGSCSFLDNVSSCCQKRTDEENELCALCVNAWRDPRMSTNKMAVSKPPPPDDKDTPLFVARIVTARSSLVWLPALCSFTRFGFSSILSDCLAFGFKCRSIGLRYDFGTEACQWSTNPDDSCELPVLRRAGLAVWADGWVGG